MRIGILTLHDSPNYGAVLQAYAMRAYLAGLGHEAFVIDRRRDGRDTPLRTPPPIRASVRLGGVLEVDARNGATEYARRCVRTLDFLRNRVGLSSCSFGSWDEAPAELGADVVVVGSDQVWNPNNLDPSDYLMMRPCGARGAIAYAASFGVSSFAPEIAQTFKRGLANFAAIGVREREAQDLVRTLGFAAEHVVDPVLLAGREIWSDVAGCGEASDGHVFAYFLAEDVLKVLPQLAAFADRTKRTVELFVDWFVRKPPRGVGGYLKNRRFWRQWSRRGIVFRLDAGPEEFVRSLRSSAAVVSNSYHALMFSAVFGKNVRVVLPSNPIRRQMNARLVESGDAMFEGPLVRDTLESALASLDGDAPVVAKHEAIARQVQASAAWLSRALSLFQ